MKIIIWILRSERNSIFNFNWGQFFYYWDFKTIVHKPFSVKNSETTVQWTNFFGSLNSVTWYCSINNYKTLWLQMKSWLNFTKIEVIRSRIKKFVINLRSLSNKNQWDSNSRALQQTFTTPYNNYELATGRRVLNYRLVSGDSDYLLRIVGTRNEGKGIIWPEEIFNTKFLSLLATFNI